MIIKDRHIVLEHIEIAPNSYYKINFNQSLKDKMIVRAFYVYKMFTEERKALHRFYVASTITDFTTKIDREKCAIIITNRRENLAVIRLAVIVYKPINEEKNI